MNNMELIENCIKDSIKAKEMILHEDKIKREIVVAAQIIRNTLSSGGTIFFCGNGGSASDALHLTGELIGRFQKERHSMAAVSLNADVASLTAIANDYGYEKVFSRQVEGLMRAGDVLFAISTSGNSENVYQAVTKAKERNGKTIALLGRDGGKIREICDIAIVVPDVKTARIQETHIMIGHILCELIEEFYE